MKKIMLYAMLMASAVVQTSCSSEDPLDELLNDERWNNGNNTSEYNGLNGPVGNGNSTTTGELATFDISLDAMTV